MFFYEPGSAEKLDRVLEKAVERATAAAAAASAALSGAGEGGPPSASCAASTSAFASSSASSMHDDSIHVEDDAAGGGGVPPSSSSSASDHDHDGTGLPGAQPPHPHTSGGGAHGSALHRASGLPPQQGGRLGLAAGVTAQLITGLQDCRLTGRGGG